MNLNQEVHLIDNEYNRHMIMSGAYYVTSYNQQYGYKRISIKELDKVLKSPNSLTIFYNQNQRKIIIQCSTESKSEINLDEHFPSTINVFLV